MFFQAANVRTLVVDTSAHSPNEEIELDVSNWIDRSGLALDIVRSREG